MVKLSAASLLGIVVLGSSLGCGSGRSRDPVDAAATDLPAQDTSAPDLPPVDADPPMYLDIEVVMTTDNAYGFGWGTKDALKTYRTPEFKSGMVAADIFNCPIGRGPEAYLVPGADAPPSNYLYIITWADRATTQGTIGQFKRTGKTAVYTGHGRWQACATGVEYNPGEPATMTGPSTDVINTQIGICNEGTGDPATTSAGWVGTDAPINEGAVGRVVFGEDNSSGGGTFPIVCQKDAMGAQGVDAEARWMWYDPGNLMVDPFKASADNATRTFLIFRLPASVVGGTAGDP